jgi:hypothetical protein
MILTAYLVLGSTSVYTPGDTHLTDMQLEQVGADILKIMDTPETPGGVSELEQLVHEYKGLEFRERFWTNYLMTHNIAAQETTGKGSSILAYATVYYYDRNEGTVKNYRFVDPLIEYSGGQPGVTVTRFVKVPDKGNMPIEEDLINRPRIVLVEVFLWKA